MAKRIISTSFNWSFLIGATTSSKTRPTRLLAKILEHSVSQEGKLNTLNFEDDVVNPWEWLYDYKCKRKSALRPTEKNSFKEEGYCTWAVRAAILNKVNCAYTWRRRPTCKSLSLINFSCSFIIRNMINIRIYCLSSEWVTYSEKRGLNRMENGPFPECLWVEPSGRVSQSSGPQTGHIDAWLLQNLPQSLFFPNYSPSKFLFTIVKGKITSKHSSIWENLLWNSCVTSKSGSSLIRGRPICRLWFLAAALCTSTSIRKFTSMSSWDTLK